MNSIKKLFEKEEETLSANFYRRKSGKWNIFSRQANFVYRYYVIKFNQTPAKVSVSYYTSQSQYESGGAAAQTIHISVSMICLTLSVLGNQRCWERAVPLWIQAESEL